MELLLEEEDAYFDMPCESLLSRRESSLFF